MLYLPLCTIPPHAYDYVSAYTETLSDYSLITKEPPEIRHEHLEREDYTPNGSDARITNRSDAATGALLSNVGSDRMEPAPDPNLLKIAGDALVHGNRSPRRSPILLPSSLRPNVSAVRRQSFSGPLRSKYVLAWRSRHVRCYRPAMRGLV